MLEAPRTYMEKLMRLSPLVLVFGLAASSMAMPGNSQRPDDQIAPRSVTLLKQGETANHPLIDVLYDARVLHVIKRGVSTHDQSGVRYDVYALDYGCYVELMTTAKAPAGLFAVDNESGEEEFVEVPTDDYRSIRRAILELDDFEQDYRGRLPVSAGEEAEPAQASEA